MLNKAILTEKRLEKIALLRQQNEAEVLEFIEKTHQKCEEEIASYDNKDNTYVYGEIYKEW